MDIDMMLLAFNLLSPSDWLPVVQIALGVTAVIFFHELGHFAVARWCGVKCEKFYVGFGKPIVKFQWGETEYGLGMIPLGGYVKMLGQDDNPYRAMEELERAKAEDPNHSAQETPQYDPRSYMAKSVPQRMAIISAGVIMNVILAVVMATVAYGWLGVRYFPCVVGDVFPGQAAWQADLRIGDEIIKIDDIVDPEFDDLKTVVSLGDTAHGVPMVVRRPGRDAPLEITVHPSNELGIPLIGIGNPWTTTLVSPRGEGEPTRKYSPAATAAPSFEPGDVILAVGDVPVEHYYQLNEAIAAAPSQTLKFTVRREIEGETKEIPIEVAPNPVKEVGLVMAWGKITAIQEGSPAAEAGLRKGDLIVKIDGEPAGDPATFPERMRRRGLGRVPLVVQREGQTVEVEVALRKVGWYDDVTLPGQPLTAPALGVAYRIVNRVQAVTPNSPAALAGLVEGDIIESIEFQPTEEKAADEELRGAMAIEFGEDHPNWPSFLSRLQAAVPGTKLSVKPAGREAVTVDIATSSEWHNPDRGLFLEPLRYMRTAETFGQAVALGAGETWEQLTLVFRFLRALVRTQVSPRMVGGPVTIVQYGYQVAKGGMSDLLMFLTMLSANLAVINFLPIPILDGGHMLFLSLEGVRGKPVSERVFVASMYVGMAFLMSVMAFVLLLDFGILKRM